MRLPLPFRERAESVAAVLLLFVAGLATSACQTADSAPWSGHPVVVLGIDGATWDVIDPLMARGELPNIRRLVERGARTDLIVLPPLTSPVVWTTYATGRFGRQHNILDFTYPYVAGEKHPVETTYRREPTLWNIASEHGRTVGLVGYYVTHPAEVVDGFVVSDALLESREGTTYPESLREEVELVNTAEERQRIYRRFLPWGYDSRHAEDPESRYHSVSKIVRGRLDGAIVRDETVRRNALALLPRGADLFMTYFRIVDHACHSTWKLFASANMDPEGSSSEDHADPTAVELLGQMIPEAHRYVDEIVGEVVRQVGEEANIVLVSDHGSGPATGVYAIQDEQLTAVLSGNHRHNGVLLAAGPDIRPGSYEGVAMTDVAPLVLALLGLPVSEELPGRVPVEMLTPGFVEQNPPRAVAAYAKHWRTVGSEADAAGDERALEQLKALGYLGSSAESGRSGPQEDAGFWAIEPRLRRFALLGELLFHLMRPDAAEVDRLMALVREKDPELAADLPAFVRTAARALQADFAFEVLSEEALSSFLERHGAQR